MIGIHGICSWYVLGVSGCIMVGRVSIVGGMLYIVGRVYISIRNLGIGGRRRDR